jgi:hypothetical protein
MVGRVVGSTLGLAVGFVLGATDGFADGCITVCESDSFNAHSHMLINQIMCFNFIANFDGSDFAVSTGLVAAVLSALAISQLALPLANTVPKMRGLSIKIELMPYGPPLITLFKFTSVLNNGIKARVSPAKSSTPTTLTLFILNLKSGKEEKILKSNSPKSTFAFKLLLASSFTKATILSLKIIGNKISRIIIIKDEIPDHFKIRRNKDFFGLLVDVDMVFYFKDNIFLQHRV